MRLAIAFLSCTQLTNCLVKTPGKAVRASMVTAGICPSFCMPVSQVQDYPKAATGGSCKAEHLLHAKSMREKQTGKHFVGVGDAGPAIMLQSACLHFHESDSHDALMSVNLY